MANSKNRRKNGKVVKVDHIKRMRNFARRDIENLIICNVVDRKEIDSDRSEMVPRTVVYNRETGCITGITRKQEIALKSERWRWCIHSGIICRKQDGTVYFDKEENVFTVTEVKLTEMNDYIVDVLTEKFQQVNKLHALTMFWVASPYDMGDPPLQAVLAPVWQFNVLGNILTRYENENTDLPVMHYKSDTLLEFCNWFLNQDKYKKRDLEPRTVTFWFEPTGEKMRKGELVTYRALLCGKGELDERFVHKEDRWYPFASVEAFCQGKRTFVSNGHQQGLFMTAVEQCPPCVNALVEVRYQDGETNLIKFSNGEVVWE